MFLYLDESAPVTEWLTVALFYRRSAVDIHRSAIPQRQPAANDPVDDPQAGRDDNHYRKWNAYESHKQKAAEETPE